jgi:hypothetical protein
MDGRKRQGIIFVSLHRIGYALLERQATTARRVYA